MSMGLALLALSSPVAIGDITLRRDREALKQQLKAFKAGGGVAREFLASADIEEAKQSSEVVVDSQRRSPEDLLKVVVGCAHQAPSATGPRDKDGRSEFFVKWTCPDGREIFGTIQMRVGKIQYVIWGSSPIVIIQRPVVVS